MTPTDKTQENQSLVEWLDQIPPFLLYYSVHWRDGEEPPPVLQRAPWGNCLRRVLRPRLGELAAASGLTNRTFNRIVTQLTWKDVPVGEVDGLWRACGANPFRMEERLAYLRQHDVSEAFEMLTVQQRARFNMLAARRLISP